MPKPQKFMQNDLMYLLSFIFVASDYSTRPDLYLQEVMGFDLDKMDGTERDPATGRNEAVVTRPEKVAKFNSAIEKMYLEATRDLGMTDPETQPMQHAMRTMAGNLFLITLSGGSASYQNRVNPLLSSLEGRLPDLINPNRFTHNPPVLDPDRLWQELKDPARELSGFEEMEIVMKRVPFPRLLKALSSGGVLLYDAMQNHAAMTEREQEQARAQMLDYVREARTTAVELKALPREDMKAFSKVFAAANRELAVDMQWYGARGLDHVPNELESLETALENHVPFSHMDVFLALLDTANTLERSFGATGVERLQGIPELRDRNRKLLELLTTDFGGFTPEEAAAHMNRIGEAAAACTDALRAVAQSLPPFETLSLEAQNALPPDRKEEYRVNEALHTAFRFKNAAGNRLSDDYTAGKLQGNTRLTVPKSAPQAPAVNPVVNAGAAEDAPENHHRNPVPEHPAGQEVPAAPEEENFDPGPHLTAVMPEGKAKSFTGSVLGKHVVDVFSFQDYMGTAFFSEEHQMQGMDLQRHFTVRSVLPWDGREQQTLFNHAGEVEITNYFKRAHDEALKSFLKSSREKTPLTYAVRSYAEMETALALSGELPGKEESFNPFYAALASRLPDLVRKVDFTGNKPETDPEKLIRQLQQPGRELSGPEELETLCRRFPVGELMAELSDNAKRLRAFREAGPEMSPQEKETLRQEMLNGCRKIKELGAGLKKLNEQELAALSRIYTPRNRENALQMDTLGVRGIEAVVLQPVAQMERILAVNVPADRVSAYLGAYSILNNIKKHIDGNSGMMSLLPDGGMAYREKLNGLLGQLGEDLKDRTPQEKEQHFEALAAGMTELLRMGEAQVKHFPYLPKNHPDRQKTEDLMKALTNWSMKPEFIAGALKNGDHYDFDHRPAALPAVLEPAAAERPAPADNRPKTIQDVKGILADAAEMLSGLYQHLHEEGHSPGVDSAEYKNFRNAVRAIHNAWNPPERRTIDLETLEGRNRARQMFDRALNTANAYYLRHAGRDDISSTYGNVRKNAALTTIDILAPSVMKQYISQGMETGMNMARDGVIIRQKIGMEELVRNEKAFVALKYADRNSRTYQQTAEKTRGAYQHKEEREAREQGREAKQIRKEDAVNTFLRNRSRRS